MDQDVSGIDLRYIRVLMVATNDHNPGNEDDDDDHGTHDNHHLCDDDRDHGDEDAHDSNDDKDGKYSKQSSTIDLRHRRYHRCWKDNKKR